MTEQTMEYLNQGIDYMAAQDYERALERFSEAVGEEPENKDPRLHQGNALASLERYDEAIEAFKTAFMLDETDGKTLFSLGSVYLLKGDTAEALRQFRKAEELGYRSANLYLVRMGMFVRAGEYYQAIRECSKAIEAEPLRGDLYVKKVGLQLEAGLTDDALVTLEEFGEILPEAAEVYGAGVDIYCYKKDYVNAERLAKEAAEKFPKDPAMRRLMIKVCNESGRYAEAEKAADEMLQTDLDEVAYREAVFDKTVALAKQEKAEETVKLLEDFTKDHKDQQALYMLMNVYAGLNRFDRVRDTAKELTEIANELHIQYAGMYYYAAALDRTGDAQGAKAEYKKLTSVFRKAVIQHPQIYELYIYRILCHMPLEEYDKALELADYLEHAYPERVDGHQYKAVLYGRMGDTKRAEEEKAKALEMDPDLKFPA